jgi:hypothetical protein
MSPRLPLAARLAPRHTMNSATPLMSEVPMAPLVVRRRPPGAPGERTRLEGAAYG